MMFGNLNASNYHDNTFFYNSQFEDILSKIVDCYQIMISDNVILPNNENEIRDVLLLKYLKNNSVRKTIGLTSYLYDREVPEDNTIGRTDIKIQTLNTFIDTNAYYIIECKRLDNTNLQGRTGLNAKYIENGILRFTSKMYSTHYKTNGMIGFIVEKLDIIQNVGHINVLLSNMLDNPKICLDRRQIHSDFDFCFCSIHNEIVIYHLMLDFSRNIAA